MRVVSAASEPTHRNKQHENTTGHDDTEFEFINHRRRLIYFNAWFGRKDGSQIVQEDIPRSRVAMQKSQMK